MSNWIPVFIAAISLVKEIVGFLKEREANKKERKKKIVRLKDGFKKARLEGDTSNIELAFADVGIDLGTAKVRVPDSENQKT